MSEIFISHPQSGTTAEIDFATLVSAIKGTSIVSLADSDRFIELGLSENLQVRIESVEAGRIRVSIYSTLNANEAPPIRLQVVAEGEEPSAALVEQRLHSLRQVYAITFLLNADRGEELATALQKNPNFDLEELLRKEERLFLQAAGPGSWWFTVFTKVKGAGQQALNTLSLLYGEGRNMLMRRVRADTEKKEAQTALEQIKVEQKQFDLDKQKANEFINLINKTEKIKNPKLKKIAQDAIWKNASTINQDIRRLLPPRE